MFLYLCLNLGGLGIHFKQSEGASMCLEELNNSSFFTLLSALHLYHSLLFGPFKYVELFAFQRAEYEASEVCRHFQVY